MTPRLTDEELAEIERFNKFVSYSDECWLWKGGRTYEGYGNFWLRKNTVRAHRYAYETCYGEIPDGLTIDHLCRNPSCVRPDHLEAVTMRENTLRGDTLPAKLAKRTECNNGHPFGEYRRADGYRRCLVCERERWKKRNARRKRDRAFTGDGEGREK